MSSNLYLVLYPWISSQTHPKSLSQSKRQCSANATPKASSFFWSESCTWIAWDELDPFGSEAKESFDFAWLVGSGSLDIFWGGADFSPKKSILNSSLSPSEHGAPSSCHVTLLTSLLLLHRIKTVGFPEPLPGSNSICSYNDDTIVHLQLWCELESACNHR